MIGITEFVASVLLFEASSVEDKYTKNLQALAVSAGWPVLIAVQLSVKIKNGQYVVDYPDGIREQVIILETGTETTPANPVIRNFLATLPQREGR